MSNIQLFNFQENDIRVVVGEDKKPWFVLKDACRVLEIGNVTDVKNRLPKHGVDSIEVTDLLGRQQIATVISLNNLYRVILRSDKPQAEPFQDWVCDKVIPSIAETGSYSLQPQPDPLACLLTGLSEPQREAVKYLATGWTEEKEKNKKLEETYAPVKTMLEELIAMDQTHSLIDLAKCFSIGPNKLTAKLREKKWLGSGPHHNRPAQKLIEAGIFEFYAYKHQNPHTGEVTLTYVPKVTSKGIKSVYSFVTKHMRESVGSN